MRTFICYSILFLFYYFKIHVPWWSLIVMGLYLITAMIQDWKEVSK